MGLKVAPRLLGGLSQQGSRLPGSKLPPFSAVVVSGRTP